MPPVDPMEIERRFRNQLDIAHSLAATLSLVCAEALEPLELVSIGRRQGLSIDDLEHTLMLDQKLFGAPHPRVTSWAKLQRKHITKQMRWPQLDELPEPMLKSGTLIDQALLRLCHIIDLWQEIADIEVRRKAIAYRARVQQEREAERQHRRAEREVEQARLTVSGNETQAVPHDEKRDKHEVVRCAKCHKRPPTHGALCEPCFKWEQAKLGRT